MRTSERVIDEQLQQELEEKCKHFTDLVELVKIQDEIESHGPGNPIDYMKLYRDIIPARLNKLWFNGLLLDKQPLEKFLYDEIEPELRKHLKSKGIDSQECFCSVEIGMSNPEYPNDWNMTFYMGFDTFEDGEGMESGFAVFRIPVYNGEIPSWDIQSARLIREVPPTLGGFRIDWNNNNYNDGISCLIHQGEGIFYTFKTQLPYKGLWDYVSDGGFILRLD